jgi:Putative zinc-finger
MTNAFPEKGGPAGRGAGHVRQDVLAAYVGGSVDEVLAWSVEAHVSACPSCRVALSAHVGPDHLARNRSVLLVRAATGEHHPARRLLGHMGVPDHLVALMAATPSLRRSWLLSVLGVLALVSGEAVLVHHLSNSPLAGERPGWGVLAPFILVAPLTVLAGVAAAFLPVLDPTHQLAAAAPFSGLGLLLVRCLSALVAALVPVVVAAFLVPGPAWLPAALLLPCLALCFLALAALTVIGPMPAALLAGAVWVLPVALVGLWHSVTAVVQWQAQASWAAALVAALIVVAVRRDRFELGRTA